VHRADAETLPAGELGDPELSVRTENCLSNRAALRAVESVPPCQSDRHGRKVSAFPAYGKVVLLPFIALPNVELFPNPRRAPGSGRREEPQQYD
jgi:hypothetical protein